jgi:bacteriorhodopsin
MIYEGKKYVYTIIFSFVKTMIKMVYTYMYYIVNEIIILVVQLGVVAHTYNLSTREVNVGGL